MSTIPCAKETQRESEEETEYHKDFSDVNQQRVKRKIITTWRIPFVQKEKENEDNINFGDDAANEEDEIEEEKESENED